MSNPHKKDEIHIREVWNHNLDNEFALIRNIVDDYPYIAMDTEFPGVVIKPIGTFSTKSELNYLYIRDNVEILKLIQLGLTFSDKNGTLPTCGTDKHCLWQFNFREFNPNEDAYAHDSIEILRKSGINFEMNCNMGVDVVRFAELLMSSGAVMNDSVQWLTFHSGYDFGYLVKLLSGRSLPRTLEGFLTLISIYFPVVYDIKHLMRYRVFLYGGLNKLADMLNVERVGTSHQAGSDSLLTCWTFFKLSESYFGGSVGGYAGVLFGIDPKN